MAAQTTVPIAWRQPEFERDRLEKALDRWCVGAQWHPEYLPQKAVH
jgi:gamma-glutamyl-gamma-aminobutyrate hydrolase PuuD